MATHSSVLAWRIPGTGEPGGLPSVGSHRVRHDWSDSAAAAAACKTQPHENLSSIPQLAFHLSSLTYIMLYPVRNLDGSKWKKLSVYLTVMLNVNLIKLLVLLPAYSKYGRQRYVISIRSRTRKNLEDNWSRFFNKKLTSKREQRSKRLR